MCVHAKPVNNNTFQLHCRPFFSFSLEKQRVGERKKAMKCEGNELEIMDIMSPAGLKVSDLSHHKR